MENGLEETSHSPVSQEKSVSGSVLLSRKILAWGHGSMSIHLLYSTCVSSAWEKVQLGVLRRRRSFLGAVFSDL